MQRSLRRKRSLGYSASELMVKESKAHCSEVPKGAHKAAAMSPPARRHTLQMGQEAPLPRSLLLLPLRHPQKEGPSGVFAFLPDAHLTAPCYLGPGWPVSRFRQLRWATHSPGPSGSTALSSKNRELGHFSRTLAPQAHAEPAPGQCPAPPAPWMTGERDPRGLVEQLSGGWRQSTWGSVREIIQDKDIWRIQKSKFRNHQVHYPLSPHGALTKNHILSSLCVLVYKKRITPPSPRGWILWKLVYWLCLAWTGISGRLSTKGLTGAACGHVVLAVSAFHPLDSIFHDEHVMLLLQESKLS